MHKTFLSLGAISGLLAVAGGAFGAHQLRSTVPEEALSVFQTGVQYQMYHTLALLIVALAYDRLPLSWTRWAGWLFCFGIIFFSGSLYVITAIKASGGTVPAAVGVLTPLGGVMFLAGWLCLLMSAFKKGSSQR